MVRWQASFVIGSIPNVCIQKSYLWYFVWWSKSKIPSSPDSFVETGSGKSPWVSTLSTKISLLFLMFTLQRQGESCLWEPYSLENKFLIFGRVELEEEFGVLLLKLQILIQQLAFQSQSSSLFMVPCISGSWFFLGC